MWLLKKFQTLETQYNDWQIYKTTFIFGKKKSILNFLHFSPGPPTNTNTDADASANVGNSDNGNINNAITQNNSNKNPTNAESIINGGYIENDDANIRNTAVDADDHDTNDSSSTGVPSEGIDSSSTGVHDIVDDNDTTGVAPEDYDDEFVLPPDENSDNGDGNGNNVAQTINHSGGVSKPYDYANKFPALYGNTNHVASASNTLCLRLY